MPSFFANNPAGRPEHQFNKTKRFYYSKKARSPTTNVIRTNSASKIKNIFCPFHGEEAVFDRLVKNEYIYKCCAMTVPHDLLGIDIKEDGILTVDGRSTRNPIYNTSSAGAGGVIVPANESRSKQTKKMVQLSSDDRQLVKQGYTILNTREDIPKGKTLMPIDSSSVDLARHSTLDKYKKMRSIG